LPADEREKLDLAFDFLQETARSLHRTVTTW
jgi:hypothetical protein